MSWVCRVCRWSLVPRPSFMSTRRQYFHSSTSNLALLLKNYMIPTIRVEQDVQSVAKNLEKKVGLAPLFYQNAPVVLDFEPSEGALETNKVVTLFNEIYKLNLIPVGITFTNDPIIQGLAKQYNIPFINSQRATTGRSFTNTDSLSHPPSPLPPSSASSSSPLNTPQKHEKMQIRSFSNSIQAEALKTTTPPTFSSPPLSSYTPLPPSPPPAPPIQLATSHGTPPPLHHPTSSTTDISSLSSPTPIPHPNSISETSEPVLPLIIKSSLRSGQQVYARNGADLIVMGSVHSGAEALADGNIHIYGSLKGRALAGVSGNLEAKIFASKFFAELISIADTYCACEEQPPGIDPNKPSVVWLEQGNLKFSAMD